MGQASALISAATSCRGLSPLLSSAPLKIAPTSCDPGPSHWVKVVLHHQVCSVAVWQRLTRAPKSINAIFGAHCIPCKGLFASAMAWRMRRMCPAEGNTWRRVRSPPVDGEILQQRENPPPLVHRALQELSDVVACCFVPLQRPGAQVLPRNQLRH